MMMILTFFFSCQFISIYIQYMSPTSTGFLTLWVPLQICLRRVIQVGKHVPASDLASSGAMWLPCGAVKAWVEPLVLLGAGCWFFVEVQLIPRSKMTSIHLSVFFFSLVFRCLFFFLERNVVTPPQLSNECRLVSGLTGWWLVVGSSTTSWKCHIWFSFHGKNN